MAYDNPVDERIAVIGLGYVGLPVAVALSEQFADVRGFDTNRARVEALRSGEDETGEVAPDRLATTRLHLSDAPDALDGCSFFVVTVPTPIDRARRPDFSPLQSACALIGPYLRPGAVVVFESTVYPGATENLCGPWLEAASGLIAGVDFTLGYSPERINPGDRARGLAQITKVLSAQDSPSLARMAAVYGPIIEAGLHAAPSIMVAEAAKVIENTQRDLNIALMNECALIFDRLGIRSADVLAAARTKWNFLDFRPGLVGGHCIGVDPYYLTARAEELGYHPQVILSGRRVNDRMGRFVAEKAVRLLARLARSPSEAKVGILGLTFKENVPDLRNSKVFDMIEELEAYGIRPRVHDPHAGSEAVRRHSNRLNWCDYEEMRDLDLAILAVPHARYLDHQRPPWALVAKDGAMIDVRAVLDPSQAGGRLYWSL
ncbi:nucleotide sugar dehydrogenase [Oceanomicrobium pacificus]|uniref:Nucleotide sugar dehydrogenase n=1 Tax=Oceanomicrobium pacificus TaxID=2692916 RepID=A0A6B0TWW3_9RHOB|nr:nucleotide sugar dehydrogenase [Oceanomicrobium pacificus]MXU65988.1 nucleotide sugar dehydrogenase [Oceanomicrobium pacificus]